MIDFVSILLNELPKYKKVLELESKKGDDLKLLDEYFEVVASENEKVKTRYLKDEFIDIRVILVDVIEVDTQKKFDCVFSNGCFDDKSFEQIKESLANQKKVLNKEGLVFHIFDSSKVNKTDVSLYLEEKYSLIKSIEVDSKFYVIARLID